MIQKMLKTLKKDICTTIDMCQFCSNSLELRLARNIMDISHLLLIRLILQVSLSKRGNLKQAR